MAAIANITVTKLQRKSDSFEMGRAMSVTQMCGPSIFHLVDKVGIYFFYEQ